MRHRNRHYLRIIASTALLLGMASNGLAQDFQHYGPVKTYTKPLPDQKFFSPSITKKLPAGYRVAGPPMIMDGSVVIQRLTERSYWVDLLPRSWASLTLVESIMRLPIPGSALITQALDS